jgi:hypothetical protein
MTPTRSQAQVPPLAVALAGLLSLAVAMGIGRFAFTPMLPLMIQAGQIDVAQGGWVAAANYAGYLLGALTAARLRWSAVRLAATALALTAILTAAMALDLSVWLWAALRLVAGVCSAWAFVATSIWCLAALSQSGRLNWSGAMFAGVGFGIAAAGAYCLVGAAAGLSAPVLWLQLAALAALLLMPVALVLRRLGLAPSAAGARTSGATPLPTGTRGLVWCYGLMGFGYILPATFLPVLARSIVDDPRQFGLAWPAFGLTAALSTFVAAWLLRRLTRLRLWSASHWIMGAGVLLPSLWVNGWTIALSALMVGGTFMIATLAGVQEMRLRAAGDPTSLLARGTTAFALGQIAGPITSSLLLRLPGFAQSGLNVSLQLAALCLFGSAAWLWRANARTL